MSKESKVHQGQATPRDPKDLKIAHDDFVLVKDKEGFLRKQRSLEQLMEHYASKDDQPDPDADKKSDEGENKISLTSNMGLVKVKSSQRRVPKLPPAFCANVRFPHVFYFRTTGAIAAKNITVSNLIGIAGTVGLSGTTATSICSAVKLASITVWPAAGSVTNNPEVAFAASGYGTNPEQSIERGIPSGVTTGGGLKFVVPETSLAGLWQNATSYSVELVTLYDIPSGSVIAVSGWWVLRDSLPGINYAAMTTEASGSFYYLFLDGNSAPKCLPIGLPNTF